MSRVYRGDTFKVLRRKLPSILVVFDGHCLMSQKRVQQVLERNFTFFDDNKLKAHAMLFTSNDLFEGKEVIRTFPITKSIDNCNLALVEKIPSARSRLQRLSRVSRIGGMQLDETAEEGDDLRVSVKSRAVLRMMTHLDRVYLRVLGHLGLIFVPRFIGDVVYDYLLDRRRLWGTSEEDAVKFPRRVDGLKERTWHGNSSVEGVNAASKKRATPPSGANMKGK